MKIFFKVIGAFFALTGVYFLFDPSEVSQLLMNNSAEKWIYITAIVARFILGALLIIAAKQSRYPIAIRVFGYLVILAGIILIFIGHNGFQDLLSWVVPLVESMGFLAGVFIVAFGGLVYYAFSD